LKKVLISFLLILLSCIASGQTHGVDFVVGKIFINDTLELGTTVWKSCHISPKIPKLPTANPATLSHYQEFPVLEFAAGADDHVFYEWVVRYQYNDADSVRLHFDVILPGACTGDSLVAFAVEYKLVAEGDVTDFGSGTTTYLDSLTFNSTSAYEVQQMELHFTTTGWTHNESVLMKLYRDVDGSLHNYENKAIIKNIHVDYKAKNIGN